MQEDTQWARFPDARQITAAYPGKCAVCGMRFPAGAVIVGTVHDGWACKPCAERSARDAVEVEWALPVGETGRRAKFNTPCRGCGAVQPVGSQIWPNIAGGWFCDRCTQTAPPTWRGVLLKVAERVRAGKPISLATPDYKAIAAELAATSFVPERRGPESEWSRDKRLSPDSGDWTAAAIVSNRYGLILDGLAYRFNPNLGTNAFLVIARTIEDPENTGRDWDDLFARRYIRLAGDRPLGGLAG